MVTFQSPASSRLTSVSAIVSCTTDVAAAVHVDWGYSATALTNTEGPTASGTTHRLPIRKLTPGRVVYWQFRSGSDLSAVQTLTTQPVDLDHGVEMPEIVDFLTVPIFNDTMLQARGLMDEAWNAIGFAAGKSYSLDANGWPQSLGVGDEWRVYAGGTREVNGNYPTGTYLLTWEGTGTVNVGFDAVESSRTANSITFDVTTPTNAGIYIQCTATSAAPDNVRNLKCWLPGKHNSADRFSDPFLALLKSGSAYWPKTLRFLEWMHTNWHARRQTTSITTGGTTRLTFSTGHGWTGATVDVHCWGVTDLDGFHTATIVSPTELDVSVATTGTITDPCSVAPKWIQWADRTLLTHQHQGGTRGCAPELMFELCNLVGADMHLPIPVNASDDWLAGFAALADANLNSGRKLIVEHGNETAWNGAFPQVRYVQYRGAELSMQGDAPTQGRRYHGHQTEHLAGAAFKQQFSNPGRVEIALGTQLADPSVTTTAALQISNQANIQVILLNPYVGGYLGEGYYDNPAGPAKTVGDTPWTEDQVFDEIERNIEDPGQGGPFARDGLRKWLVAHAAEATSRGWGIRGYEKNLHTVQGPGGAEVAALTTLFVGAEWGANGVARNPRGYETMAMIAEECRRVGMLSVSWFKLVGKYTKDGPWGGIEVYSDVLNAKGRRLEAWIDMATAGASTGGPVGAGVVNAMFSGTAYQLPSTVYIALLSVMGSDSKGTGYAEVDYDGYKRIAVSGGTFTAANTANSVDVIAAIRWATTPSNIPPGTRVAGLGFFDDSGRMSGTHLFAFAFSQPVTLVAAKKPRIPDGTVGAVAMP